MIDDDFIRFDDNGGSIYECSQCGGEGGAGDCFDGCCEDFMEGCDACWRRCDVCGGRGSYTLPASPKKTDQP